MPTYTCDECDMEVATQRGLNIHMTRKHGVPEPTPTKNPSKGTVLSLDEARQKFYETIGRAKISPVVNMGLNGPAIRYADPSIRLSDEEASSLDAAAREIAAEYGGGAALSIAQYLPILNALFVVGPMLLDKVEKIQYWKAVEAAGGLPRKDAPRPSPVPPIGGAPTLTRKDIQPDLEPGE